MHVIKHFRIVFLALVLASPMIRAASGDKKIKPSLLSRGQERLESIKDTVYENRGRIGFGLGMVLGACVLYKVGPINTRGLAVLVDQEASCASSAAPGGAPVAASVPKACYVTIIRHWPFGLKVFYSVPTEVIQECFRAAAVKV